jgi:hypothetical protein
MGRHRHVHSFGDWHQSHHSRHHDHHHHHDHVFGGPGDDVLVGTAKSSVIIGGRGDDIAVFAPAAHSGADVCGKGDFYDGGGGHDVLRLILTADELSDAGVQADIAAFQAFLADNPHKCGGHGEIFKFTSFDLAVRNFEELDIQGDGTPPAGSNTPPEAAADAYTVTEDLALTLDVLANDSDADGDALTAVVVDNPAHGSLDLNDDGSITYTPEEDYFGSDHFTYKANDGTDDSGVTNVDIEVLAVNDAPELKDENDPLVWQASKGTVVHIDVLSHYAPGPPNEADQTITLSSASAVNPLFGNLFGISQVDNTIVYMAPTAPERFPPGHHETIAFEITDDLGLSTTAELQIDII